MKRSLETEGLADKIDAGIEISQVKHGSSLAKWDRNRCG
jgi:hypothetical protein